MRKFALCVLSLLAVVPAAIADPPIPTDSLPWADVTGDGIPEEVRLRAVVRNGISGFDFGVWNPVGDHYLGDIARLPQTPGMLGYSISVGPDLDGDGRAELWIADPAAREFATGRGCVYVYSWKQPEPLLRLRGPETDTLGTDLRISRSSASQPWKVLVASHFQDIFGHVYQRWNTYTPTGTLESTEEPTSATLVLKSGDVDKSLSTDENDIAKVYLKAAELMEGLGITGQKHDEDLDGDDFVDAADILKVLLAVGVPEPSVASLTESSLYNVAPQRGLSGCGRCSNAPCCFTGSCTCVTIYRPLTENEKPRGTATHPGWWKPTSQPPGGTPLPPGIYPDRRVNRDPQHPPELCDGFRVLPGDIEHGGVMLPAVFNFTTDSITARIDNPSIAQFCADATGKPLPSVEGGDIELRGILSDAQLRVANGRIVVYGLIPGDTSVTVEVRTRSANGTMETQEFSQPVRVGGRVEFRLKAARRWSASEDAWLAHEMLYNIAAAVQASEPEPTYVGTPDIVIPGRQTDRWSTLAGPGTRPLLRGETNSGDGSDQVLVFDACDEPIIRKTAFFTKRLFLGEDMDGDGVSDPTEDLNGHYVNAQRIEESIAAGKGPFHNTPYTALPYRSQASPGSEIAVVLVGHSASRLLADDGKARGQNSGRPLSQRKFPMRDYYFPKIFGDIIPDGSHLRNPENPQFEGLEDFERWAGRDAGREAFTPTYHKFRGPLAQLGRNFAAVELPQTVDGYQRQAVTAATCPLPILNAAIYQSLEDNFNTHVVLGQAKLYEPDAPGESVTETFEFTPWRIFGAPHFGDAQHNGSLQLARQWVTGVNADAVAADYWTSSGLPPPQIAIPMTQEEWDQLMEEVGSEEAHVRSAIFWTETATGFIPCADAGWFVFYATMQVMGDSEDHKIDMAMSVIGLAADVGYVGAVAGVASNGAVAAVRIAIRYITKIDNGRTVKFLLKHGDDLFASLKKIVLYVSHYRPQWLASVDLTSPMQVASAIKRYALEAGELLSNGFRRVAKSKVARSMESMVDASGAPWLIHTYEESMKALLKGPVDKMAVRMLTAEATEGWSILARIRGVPEIDQVVVKLRASLDAGDVLSKEAADLAIDRLGTTQAKCFAQAIPNDAGVVLDPNALRRVRESTEAIMHSVNSQYRHLLTSHVGVGKAFSTMEEFEACRFMRASSLTSQQVSAMKSIREGIEAAGGVQFGTPLRKVIDPEFADKLTWPHGTPGRPNPQVGGFFTRQADVQDLSGAPLSEVKAGLGLDYPGNQFSGGYATIDFPATADTVTHTRTPKSAGFYGGGNDRYIPDDTPLEMNIISPFKEKPNAYPYTGNGFVASRDGVLRPEWHMDARVTLPDGALLTKRNSAGEATDVYQLVRSIVNNQPVEDWIRVGP